MRGSFKLRPRPDIDAETDISCGPVQLSVEHARAWGWTPAEIAAVWQQLKELSGGATKRAMRRRRDLWRGKGDGAYFAGVFPGRTRCGFCNAHVYVEATVRSSGAVALIVPRLSEAPLSFVSRLVRRVRRSLRRAL